MLNPTFEPYRRCNKGIKNGADTDAIYLDYAKAFEKVDHQLLIKKLHRYGFNEHLVLWFNSSLTHRSQHVVVNGIASFIAAVLSGVPQGSVLRPFLSILFINDMQLCIKHSIIRFFADDTRVLKHISCQKHVSELNEDKFQLTVHKHIPQSLLYELHSLQMKCRIFHNHSFTSFIHCRLNVVYSTITPLRASFTADEMSYIPQSLLYELHSLQMKCRIFHNHSFTSFIHCR